MASPAGPGAAVAAPVVPPIAGRPMAEVHGLFVAAVPLALGEARIRADAAAVAAAEAFLNQLQRSTEAWAVMAHALEATPISDDGPSTFLLAEAARVLASKTRHDMLGLAEASHESLRAMILRCMLRLAGHRSAEAAFRHLGTALAAAAVTMPGWSSVVGSLVAACGGAPRLSVREGIAEVLTLLTVLAELPSEVERPETTVATSRRRAVRDDLKRSAEGVHSTLEAIMTSHAADAEAKRMVFRAFTAWASPGFIPTVVLPRSRLMAALMAELRHEHGFEERSTLALDVLECSQSAPIAAKQALAAGMLPHVVEAEALLRTLIATAADDETDPRATTLTAITASVGIMAVRDLVMDGTPISAHRASIGRMLAGAVASTVRPVQIEAMRFWLEYLRAATELRGGGDPVPADVMATAAGLLPRLVEASVIPEADFDATPVRLGVPAAEAAAAALAHFDAIAATDVSQDEAVAIEMRERDTSLLASWTDACLEQMCSLAGTDAIVRLLSTQCTAALAEAVAAGGAAGGRDVRIRRAEAALTSLGFAVRGAIASADLPGVAELLAALPATPGWGALHTAALALIRRVAHWLVHRPPALAAACTFLQAHISQPSPVARAACRAISSLCDASPAAVRSSGLVPAVTASMLRLPEEACGHVLRCFGTVVGESDSDVEISAGVEAVMGPLVAELTAVATNPAEGIRNAYTRECEAQQLQGRRPRTSPDAVETLGVRGIRGVIARIPHFVRGLVDSHSSHASHEHVGRLASALWPVLGAVADLAKGHEDIATAVCSCHNAFLRVFPALYRGQVESLAADLARRYEASGHGCYMFTGARLLDAFGPTATTPEAAALSDMVTRMAMGGFSLLASTDSVDAFNDNPGLVDDLFVLITAFAKHMPDTFLGWTLRDDSIRCAYAGLFSSRQVAQSAVLLYFQTVIRIGVPFMDDTELLKRASVSLADRIANAARRKPSVVAAIGPSGYSVIKRLIAGAAGAMQELSIDSPAGSISSTLLALRDLLTTAEFRPFFAENLSRVVPDSVIHPEEKAKIVEDVCFRGVGPSRSYEFQRMDGALALIHGRCMAAFRAGRFDIPEM